MRTEPWLLIGSVLLAGCFEEGGDQTRTASAEAMGQGLLAFPDVHRNLTIDPALAGEALFAFIKTPIAAHNLIAPPFALAGRSGSARLVGLQPAPVPACLATSGPSGCDAFQTTTTCEAGDFAFTGNASRTCTGCPATPDVAGACDYGWSLNLGYVTDETNLQLEVAGLATVTAASIAITSTWAFDLTDADDHRIVGDLVINSCGTATIRPGPPRRLINASFVVFENLGLVPPPHCAVVSFDADGDVTATYGNAHCDCSGI